ncbi:hypothetical protein UFOVP324_11 [uncultured Caudovirales phage]|uniref:Uncharacterized protein n=1 Tax=uncultured Caudovirales phage TaxID=2100421 RepID=A0A6J5LRC7_9CAUD|nr:hypothetical protein UFOVP324_11 [uncultured Caudovirales phage]
MALTESYKVIKKYRDYVIQQSRSNLTKLKHKSTGSLYKSLKGEILSEDNYFLIGFEYNYYGEFIDKGVKGKVSGAKAPTSPYKFGSGKSKKKGGLTQGIEKWVKQKRIQFRDKESGKFISYKSTAFIIARSIYMTGIKSSFFFTKPFNAGYKKYIQTDLVKALKIDFATIVDNGITIGK